MKYNFNTTALSMTELTAVNGGDGGFVPYDGPVVYLFKWIYEFSKVAAEYQASLPPNLKK